MAAAGIATSDSSVFEEMVAADPAEIRELALASRALIFDVLPRTVEVVWPRQRTAGYGTGPKKPREPGPASTGHGGDNASGTADCLTGAPTSARERHPGLLVEIIEVACKGSARGQRPQRVADHQ
jgi:hypothetical protein